MALGEDGSSEKHPETKQTRSFEITQQWLNKVNDISDARNNSLFAHGYNMISRRECKDMAEMVTEMFYKLFDLEMRLFDEEFGERENVRDQRRYGGRFLRAADLEMEVTDTLQIEELPYSYTKEKLLALCKEHGVEVGEVTIRDRDAQNTKRGKGFKVRDGFVKLKGYDVGASDVDSTGETVSGTLYTRTDVLANLAKMVEQAVEKLNNLSVEGSDGNKRKIRVKASDKRISPADKRKN